MAINVSQSFHRTSANPVDDTMALTKAEMLTINDNLMPSKYLTICQDDGYIYLYDKANTVDPTTGKFRKFEGGSGGGNTNSVELTQAQYNALSPEEKANGTVYFITDGQGGGGGASALSELTDVEIDNPTDGQVLKYNATTQEWENGEGGGGGTDEKAYHTDDTTFTAIADDDFVPMYDISASGAKKSTWSNIKDKLKTYFDTLYFKLTDAMPSEDMSEIIDPLPNVLPRTYEYSTKEREVGKWLNGETIYEKVVYEIVEKGTSSTVYADTIDSDMKHIIYCQHFAWYQYTDTSTNRAGIAPVPLKASNGDTFASVTQYGSFVKQSTTNSKLRWTYKNDHTSGTVEFYTIIRYTKTT